MLKAMSDLTRGQRESHGDARLTELRAKLRESVGAIISYWEQAPRATTAPVVVRDAIANLAARVDASDAALLRAVERLVRAAMSSVEDERQWTTEPLRALIRFLNVLTRQLCRDIRESEAAVNTIDHSSQTRLLAALMVIEDATCAVEGYRALPPFRHVDEAYLAKYGLLQALQLGFDAAEDVGKVLGIRLRADAGERGKVVKMTRNVVAGHPVGGSMQGRAWEHFHDRASVHDKAVMKIMSFASGDSDHWTGQTQLTAQIISDGLTIIGDLLRRSIAELAPDSD
jgi:hypothetical protein